MWRTTLNFACGLIFPAAVLAAPENITPGEMAVIPAYCPHTQTFAQGTYSVGIPTAAQKPWADLLGSGFWHLHHYCWALIDSYRAKTAGLSADQRKHLYTIAVADSYYVIKNSPPDFILLPEIYFRVGQFYVELNEPWHAIDHFQKSRELKPDYWPAYQGLSQVNERLGRRAVAVEALKAGLAQVPEQPDLLSALRKLSEAPPPPKRSRAVQAPRP